VIIVQENIFLFRIITDALRQSLSVFHLFLQANRNEFSGGI